MGARCSGCIRLHNEIPTSQFREGPGKPPYQLDIKAILPATTYNAITRKKKLTFHFNGDMGGIQYAVPQELVAKGMEADFHPENDPSENPAFLYIVGDCVYFNGEVKEYYTQFYQPYEFYPAPILEVPGNHDGENLPDDETLKGFVRNFCAEHPVKMTESGDSLRTAMVQPDVYWTLLTPLASFVGLYTNVPAGGDVRPPQTPWLVTQLKTLPKDRPLIVTMHHPIYSADDHHSGSTYMKTMLEGAVKDAGGRHPEMVVAGHVHNYQRLTKKMPNGSQVPYLVTGAGGYHNLHHVMMVNGQHLIPPAVFHEKDGDPVTLERYSDDRFGFLRLEITDRVITGRYYTVPRPQEPYSKGNQLFDYFEFDWRRKRWIPNSFQQ
jgi:hypothetical protein